MTLTRILLADDQALIRSGIALVLSSDPTVSVIGEYANGHDLVAAVSTDVPDLVLTDIRMPGMDGIQATTLIKALPSPPPVLVLTTFDDDEVLWPALTAGADGFVLKDSPADAFLAAVHSVAAGGAWLDPRVLPRVITKAAHSPATPPVAVAVFAHLTPREMEVLDLICEGASNTDIAGRLHTSERTAKAHVSAIFQKLGTRDRAGTIITAYENGWRRHTP